MLYSSRLAPRSLLFAALVALVFAPGCGGGAGTPPVDASVDASPGSDMGTTPDAATDPDEGLLDPDAGSEPDAGALMPASPWIRTTEPGSGSATLSGIARDASGSVFVAGFIQSSAVTFGTQTVATPPAGTATALIGKLDADGVPVWLRVASGDPISSFTSVEVDGSGNVYAAGYVQCYDTETVVTFGPSVTTTCTSASSADFSAVLVKYDATGAAVWARLVSGGHNTWNDVVVDGAGNATVVGTFRGVGPYDFGVGDQSGTSGDLGVIARYAADGTNAWVRFAGSNNGSSLYNDVALDDEGNAYVAGQLMGGATTTFSFGPSATLANVNGAHGVLARYAPNGDAAWATRGTGPSGVQTEYQGVAVGTQGRVYAVGAITGEGTYTFGQLGSGDALTGAALPGGAKTALLVIYDRSGPPRGAYQPTSGTGRSEFIGAAVDSDGQVYASGYVRGTDPVSFGTDTVTGVVGGANMLLVKLSATGTHRWARGIVTAPSVTGFSDVVASGGNVYGVGLAYGMGAFDFGDGLTITGVTGVDNSVIARF